MAHLTRVKKIAKSYGLDWRVVGAMVSQESAGNQYAVRYEPRFFARYLEGKSKAQLRGYWPSPIPTFDTELRLRATSLGLMQVMGQTAREVGFDGQYLTELTDPSVSLECGCSYLRKMLDRAERKGIVGSSAQRYALTRYNGSAHYPDLIYARIDSGAYKEI